MRFVLVLAIILVGCEDPRNPPKPIESASDPSTSSGEDPDSSTSESEPCSEMPSSSDDTTTGDQGTTT